MLATAVRFEPGLVLAGFSSTGGIPSAIRAVCLVKRCKQGTTVFVFNSALLPQLAVAIAQRLRKVSFKSSKVSDFRADISDLALQHRLYLSARVRRFA
jgi:hypothetical protein